MLGDISGPVISVEANNELVRHQFNLLGPGEADGAAGLWSAE